MNAENLPNNLFKDSLTEELLRRTQKNANYSIRSFAKHLEIEPSSLAQILSGKRKLTDKMCERLGGRLGYSPLKMNSLMKGSARIKQKQSQFGRLDQDAFKVIADWHYYAILELTYCDEFKPNLIWISKVLNLKYAVVFDAVERLKRLNYLEVSPTGKWIDRLGDVNNLGNEIKAPAFAEHQRQVLKKALKALDETPYEQRVQSSMTLPISKNKLKEAKEMILNFIEDLNDHLKSGKTKDEVYNISVSLYPLTQINQEVLNEK